MNVSVVNAITLPRLSWIRTALVAFTCIVLVYFLAECDAAVRLARAAPSSAAASPRAVLGGLNAEGWDFSRGNLVLDGEWELYFGQLLEPGAFVDHSSDNAAIVPTGYATVPGSWHAAATDADPLPRHGVATYRLLVTGLAPGNDVSWALEIPYARTAYRLWVNGVLVASNGIVSANAADVRPQYKPSIVTVPTPTTIPSSPAYPDPTGAAPEAADANALEIVMHVANVHFREGGLPRSLALGPLEQVTQERQKRVMLQMLLMGAIGLMSLFYFMTYAWRSTEKSSLYFAMLSGNVAVRSFFTGELPFAAFLPDFPWELLLRIEYVTAYLGPATLMLFLYSLYPQEVSRTARTIWLTIGAAGVTISVLLPVRWSSLAIPVHTVLVATLIPYVGYVLVQAARRKREAAEFTLVGGLIFLAAVVLTMLHYNQLWIDLDLVPAGVFALLVSQALALSRRLALSFRRARQLAHENGLLLEETRRRLVERNRLHRLLTEQDEHTRRRIAEALHGRAQARLFSASQAAERAAVLLHDDPREAAKMILAVRDVVEQVREEEIRNASHQLHPEAIRAGLIGAVESLCDGAPDELTIELSVADELVELDDPGGSGLHESLRLGLYRIVEEALNNIHRHAGAHHVRVTMALTRLGMDEGPHIELIISDDGLGFNPETTVPGLGLQLIAARTADLDGEWHMSSQPGRGTVLRVVVPINPT